MQRPSMRATLAGMATLATLALLAVAAMPPAAAQHAHVAGSGVVISHDAGPDGYEFVGNLAHFGVLTLGDDLVPDFHQQNHIRVTLNGAVLFETTADSGHDYDGVNLFDVTFPVAGTYTVEALDDSGAMLAMFNGTVTDPDPADDVEAILAFEGPDAITVGVPATYSFGPRDTRYRLLDHTDAWFEVRDASGLLLRTKTHAHAQNQTVTFTLPPSVNAVPSAAVAVAGFTNVEVRITAFVAFPGPETPTFLPITTRKSVTVEAAPPATDAPPAAVPTAPDPPLSNAVVRDVENTPYELVGTYDPWTTVGPYTQMRLTALAMDPASGQPVPHVDFTATLTDRVVGTVLFSSSSLHEYDGIWEFVTTQHEGEYVLSVDANRGDWNAHIELPFAVVPPAAAVLPGGDTPASLAEPVEFVDVTGFDGATSGVPFTMELFIHDAAGLPLEHSEIDFTIGGGVQRAVPVLAGKLHTHDSGRFALTASLPEGNYALSMLPFALEPRPAAFFYGPPCDGGALAVPVPCHVGISIPFTVGPGPGFPAAPQPDAPATAATQPVPSLGPLMALGIMALGALASRRFHP